MVRIAWPKDEEAGRKYLSSLGVSRNQLTEEQWEVVASVGYSRSRTRRNVAIMLLALPMLAWFAFGSLREFDRDLDGLLHIAVEKRWERPHPVLESLAGDLIWDAAPVGACAALVLGAVIRTLLIVLGLDLERKTLDEFIRHMKRPDDRVGSCSGRLDR